jgi:hypothetical protein
MENVLKISQNQVIKLEKAFEELESQRVIVDIMMNKFNPWYEEKYFSSWIDEEGIQIGNVERSSLITWEDIQRLVVNHVGQYVDIQIYFNQNCVVRIYN